MNFISKCSNIVKNIKIGKNNIICDNVTIMNDVIIGNNNKILPGTIIHPNTMIGDNNIFMEQNVIGQYIVDSKQKSYEKIYGGVTIGDDNYFRIKNTIYSGLDNKTIIGNNNKILFECVIAHDCIIENNVYMYPRSFICGGSTLQSNSGMGVGAILQQNKIVGEYSFIGMNGAMTKNAFPFIVYVNNVPIRINKHRIPEQYHIYEEVLLELAKKYHTDNNNITINKLPKTIQSIIEKFLFPKNK